MNSTFLRSCSAIASTAVLSAVVVTMPQAAHAFSFSLSPVGVNNQATWNGISTTGISFDGRSGDVVAGTTLATSAANGNATITTAVDALYTSTSLLFTGGGTHLRIGSRTAGNSFNDNPDGRVQIDFNASRGLGFLGFFWGTPNLNSQVTFTLRNALGVTNTVTYTAANIFGSDLSNGRFVNFFSTNNGSNAGKVIQSILFEDTTRPGQPAGAFRIDNLAYQAIPTPALLPGLVALGIGAVRKRKAEAEAEA